MNDRRFQQYGKKVPIHLRIPERVYQNAKAQAKAQKPPVTVSLYVVDAIRMRVKKERAIK